ncbi:hypothetical protein [Methylophilus aquaticus]|uniref:Uncharacterized protein n=1 Tax=Methylophilus aquaticus TaxID=1971610 RepID=A0ABT9JRG4_9PROT|nr:hypothetical protein [Methylophilus aquaticus]MDP8567166.1 hypothetical protein [Methylophilus aquaticus]
MKKLLVTVQVELDIPDTWALVEHPDEVQAIKLADGRFMYMSFLPMFTTDANEGAEWSSECSDEFTETLLDMVADEEVLMKFETD